MSIEFRCTCGKLLRTQDNTAGKQAKCPQCGTVLSIPAQSIAVEEPVLASGVPELPPIPGTSNPYQAPAAYAGPIIGREQGELATRSQRFVGAFVDGLLMTVAIMVGIFLLLGARFGAADEFQMQLWGVAFAMPVLIFQWVLISNSGQTLGKKLAGTRIVDYDTGVQAGFVNGVVRRAWVVMFISFIPYVQKIFGLVDAVWIFGPERRCLHDLIANTKVVQVR